VVNDLEPTASGEAGRQSLDNISLTLVFTHRYVCIFLNEGAAMPTNLAIDDKLIENARRIGKHKTKKAVVTEALVEYIQRREQLKILGLFGTIDYDKNYDYKDQRRRN